MQLLENIHRSPPIHNPDIRDLSTCLVFVLFFLYGSQIYIIGIQVLHQEHKRAQRHNMPIDPTQQLLLLFGCQKRTCSHPLRVNSTDTRECTFFQSLTSLCIVQCKFWLFHCSRRSVFVSFCHLGNCVQAAGLCSFSTTSMPNDLPLEVTTETDLFLYCYQRCERELWKPQTTRRHLMASPLQISVWYTLAWVRASRCRFFSTCEPAVGKV